LPEYEVSVKFHIFPFKKVRVTAKSKEEAKQLANKQAKLIKDDLKYSIDKVIIKSHNIDDFL
jgi:hypothetical protein